MVSNYIEFRVTSTYHRNKIQFIYGAPVISGTTRRKSAKDYIIIQADRNQLPMEPAVGQQWKVTGEYIEQQNARNERLYNDITFKKPDSLEITLPQTDEGFIRFIANQIDNISDEKARNLWSAFGNKVYSIIENEDKESLLSVKGMGVTSVHSLIKGYKTYSNIKYCNWMAKQKVPLDVQQRLLKYHTNKSVEVIKENPFELVTFGMSFTDVDELATTTFEIKKDAEVRLAAAVRQAMTKLCKRGHTYIDDIKKLKKEIASLIGREMVEQSLKIGKKQVTYITFKQFNNTYHHHDRLIVETAVAKRIAMLATAMPDIWGSNNNKAYNDAIGELPYGLTLTHKQQDAVQTSLCNHISLITGGAGTGKTTVTRTVLRAYHNLGYKITATALSGRASMRLHESIGFATATIAKFLRQDSLDDYDQEGNEIKHILVIDESSMVDVVSMYRVLNHITSNCRLLFVGDPHQLPPIGPGLVLSELEKIDIIPKTHLDIVKRQEASSGIPEYSTAIRNGCIPENLTTGAIEFHHNSSTQTVIDLYCDEPENSMILAATNNTVDDLNIKIQNMLNPDSPCLKFETVNGQWQTEDYRINDPILFTSNNYEAGYQNGSLGTLIDVEQKSDGSLGTVKLNDSGEEIKITYTVLDSMKIGYAITLHKAQGSQFKNVIVVLDKTGMVDRSWLYTAVTRSEESLHIVGKKERFVKAVQSESAFNKRNAHLGWLIENYIELLSEKHYAA